MCVVIKPLRLAPIRLEYKRLVQSKACCLGVKQFASAEYNNGSAVDLTNWGNSDNMLIILVLLDYNSILHTNRSHGPPSNLKPSLRVVCDVTVFPITDRQPSISIGNYYAHFPRNEIC